MTDRIEEEASRVERNIYDSPVRAAEEGNTHTAMSVDTYMWHWKEKPVKVRILYRRGDYELRFAGAPSIPVPDVNAARPQLMALIARCRKWKAVNWL